MPDKEDGEGAFSVFFTAWSNSVAHCHTLLLSGSDSVTWWHEICTFISST